MQTRGFRFTWLRLAALFVAVVFMAGSLWALTPAQSAHASALALQCSDAITVTSNANSGAGTLRQAILDICPGGTITFAGDYAIQLGSELVINQDITIDGAGHTITLKGDQYFRVFNVSDNVTFALKNLTVANARLNTGNGGGMLTGTGSTVNVTNVTFNDNITRGNGGAIYSNGTLNITGAVLTNNMAYSTNPMTPCCTGGAIYNNGGTLTLTGVTLSGNTASVDGGAIYTTGSAAILTISDSTIANNTGTWGSGGVSHENGTVHFTNVTLSGNSSGSSGSAYTNISTGSTLATFTNVTVTKNSGGTAALANEKGQVILRNSIIAGQTSGANCYTYNVAFTNEGGNLQFGDSSCPGILVADPKLTALGNYGGTTQTHALLPGSPAIHYGVLANCPDADQRGISRKDNGQCDSGAVESRGYRLSVVSGSNQTAFINTAFALPLRARLQYIDTGAGTGGVSVTFSAPAGGASAALTGSPALTDASGYAQVTAVTNNSIGSYTVTASAANATPTSFALNNTCDITVTSSANSGAGTLRQAILNTCPGGTITFAGDYAIQLSSELVVNKNITIDGVGRNVTLKGGTNIRVLNVSDNVTFALKNLTVANANLDWHVVGGYNGAADGGGLLAGSGSTVNITNVPFQNNQTNNSGGAISSKGTVNISGGALTNNQAIAGGAIYIEAGSLTINGVSFSDNNSTFYQGGAIYSNGGGITITGASFSRNHSQDNGGAIHTYGNLTITNSSFSNNQAAQGGGAIIQINGNLTISESAILNNQAVSAAGVYNLYGSVSFTNVTLSGNSTANTALFDGAAYKGEGTSLTTFTNVTVTQNSSSNAAVASSGRMILRNSIIAGQTSGKNCYFIFYSPTNDGGNLQYGDNSCTGIPVVDPKLAVLGDYGGTTQTHALLSGSPAIDGGVSAYCPAAAKDQRGFERLVGSACDSGAVEFQYGSPTPVTQAISGTGVYRFAPSNVTIDVTNAGGCLSGLSVTQFDGSHPNASATTRTGRYWRITPTGCSMGFSANLTLPHNSIASPQVCRWTSGSMWDCALDGSSSAFAWRNGIMAFSDWAVGNGSATSVTITQMAASQQVGGILLEWDTAVGANIVGFNVYRSEVGGAAQEKINETLIAAQPTPHYTWLDLTAQPGTHYEYWVEVLTADGSSIREGSYALWYNYALFLPQMWGKR